MWLALNIVAVLHYIYIYFFFNNLLYVWISILSSATVTRNLDKKRSGFKPVCIMNIIKWSPWWNHDKELRLLYREPGILKLQILQAGIISYVKEKCTLVQALRLCTGRTAHRGSRGIDLPSHDHRTRRGWGVSVTPRPLFTPGKDPVPIVQEAGWTPGPFWTGAKNLAPHQDSIPGPSIP